MKICSMEVIFLDLMLRDFIKAHESPVYGRQELRLMFLTKSSSIKFETNYVSHFTEEEDFWRNELKSSVGRKYRRDRVFNLLRF